MVNPYILLLAAGYAGEREDVTVSAPHVTTLPPQRQRQGHPGMAAPRGPALRCAHTKHSQKAGPISVARLKMDLPFHTRLAYNRVHGRSASPRYAPFFRTGGALTCRSSGFPIHPWTAHLGVQRGGASKMESIRYLSSARFHDDDHHHVIIYSLHDPHKRSR